MNADELLLFNLLLNSICSFLAGILVVWFAIEFFRLEDGRTKLFLYALPFIKILWDFTHGLPNSSILYAGINPLNLPPKHQNLSVWAAFTKFGPIFSISFSAKDLFGNIYSTSLADYIVFWTGGHIHPYAPKIILYIFLLISFFFIGKRFWQIIYFTFCRIWDRFSARCIRKIPLKFRLVDVYISKRFSGVPFAGGIIFPYICFPQDSFESLTEIEREAVIKHELAHICHWDLPQAFGIKFLGDLFWFVPFYNKLSRAIDDLREILADERAIKLGAHPIYLAQALLKLQESLQQRKQEARYCAFFRNGHLIKTRIQNLLGNKKKRTPRFGMQNIWVRTIFVFWITSAVMVATVGGNHADEDRPVAHWVEKLMRHL